MKWTKISDNPEVIELLKKREEIEKQVHRIDPNALVNYELSKL